MRMMIQIIMCGMICFTFKAMEINNYSTNNIIYIDPGHGGIDGGCMGYDGTLEKDINLEIALEVRDALVNLGWVVELTRIGDYDLSSNKSENRKREDILKRCEIMSEGLLFVSIHCNSYQGNVRGAQTFYTTDEGKALATNIQETIIKMVGNTTRVANKIQDKYILENMQIPGCLVEVGFLSCNEELILLKDHDYQKQMAYAIAIGINDYLSF